MLTDNEIIKALECCINDDCDNCPDTFGNCEHNAMRNALDLIKRLQAKIERLKEKAYLEGGVSITQELVVDVRDIDNLVEEMTEDGK